MHHDTYLNWAITNTKTTWWHDSADTDELAYALEHGCVGVTCNPYLSNLAIAIANPANLAKLEASFRDEMKKILSEGFTAEEIEAGKKSWLQSRQVSRENDEELVSRLVSRTYERRTMAFDAQLEEKVKALTPDQVRAAMAKYLDPGGLTYMRAGDFKKVNVSW